MTTPPPPGTPRRPLVWLTGAAGQLGTALLKLFPEPELFDWLPTTHAEVDLTRCSSVVRFLEHNHPAAIVNCAAYTDVNGAESLSPEELFRINVLSVMQLHQLAPETPLLQISTDYVFGGDLRRDTPYTEEDLSKPLNRYGLSKHELEQYLIANHEHCYLLRTSWLYGPAEWGKSFYRSIRDLATSGEVIRCVEDEVGSPTSTLTLGCVIVRLLSDLMKGLSEPQMPPPDLYQVADDGEVSRYDFARAISTRVTGREDYPITPIRQSDLRRPATRPHYSALATKKIRKYYPELIRPWETALDEVTRMDSGK